MGVLRARAQTRGVSSTLLAPRDGSWEAHQPSSWASTSSQHIGAVWGDAWRPASRGRPPSSATYDQRNPAMSGRLSSEVVGSWTGAPPMPRPRPPSKTTIMLRNAAVREGLRSSDPIGMHTGVIRAEGLLSPRSRPVTAPLWASTHRTSDAIGTHPVRQPIDYSNPAAMHYEAQFALKFGDKGREVGAVLASADTVAAVRFQQEAMARAQAMVPKPKKDTTATDNTSLRADGTRMEKMEFDAVYSEMHVNKDTESAIAHGTLVPRIDPRCITRPKNLGYGLEHRIGTASGRRPVLPSRSFMSIGEGGGRAHDF